MVICYHKTKSYVEKFKGEIDMSNQNDVFRKMNMSMMELQIKKMYEKFHLKFRVAADDSNRFSLYLGNNVILLGKSFESVYSALIAIETTLDLLRYRA